MSAVSGFSGCLTTTSSSDRDYQVYAIGFGKDTHAGWRWGQHQVRTLGTWNYGAKQVMSAGPAEKGAQSQIPSYWSELGCLTNIDPPMEMHRKRLDYRQHHERGSF